MKKLIEKEIGARFVVYDEAIDHLDGDVYDNKLEYQQGRIVQRQLIALKEKFFRKYCKK